MTYKTLFGIVSGLVGTMAMILWMTTSGRIETAEAKLDRLEKQKVEKEDFFRAMEKIDKQYERIDLAIRQHELNSAKRRGD